MYSGLALLKDVHYPAATNGYDIIFVPGTGFHPPLAYDAPPLKATPAVPLADQPEDTCSICWVFWMEWVTLRLSRRIGIMNGGGAYNCAPGRGGGRRSCLKQPSSVLHAVAGCYPLWRYSQRFNHQDNPYPRRYLRQFKPTQTAHPPVGLRKACLLSTLNYGRETGTRKPTPARA